MALKDWKKIDRIYPTWKNAKTEDAVTIFKTLQIREPYYVQYGTWVTSARKFFMTKTEALKFAKSYMRTH